VKSQVETAVRELVINALLDQAFRSSLAVTEDQIQRYYDERRALFRRTETTVRVRQIVLDDGWEARQLQRELSRNPERFEELARSRSKDPSATEGGDLGYISASTAYNAEIWQAVQRLSDNEISRPINSDAGWHILKVEDARPAGSIKTLDEVRPDIVNRLRTAKRIALVTELVERQKLREPYVIYEDMIGPRGASVPPAPVSADTLDGPQ
jgi:peptidyl-prolyl cis-trans isomerase C